MKLILQYSIGFCITLTLIVSSAANSSDANNPCLIYDQFGEPIPNAQGSTVISQSDVGLLDWFGTDEISMVQIGTLVAPMYNTMTGGDSDQDGLFEAYMYIKDNAGGWTYTYRIYENDGQNNYQQVFQADEGMIPYAYGDQDSDSLPEVIGQWSYWVDVFESPAPGRLATQLVWQSPQMYNVTGYTTIGDLDQDGLGEIIHTMNSFGSDNRLVIFECNGDNSYQPIFNQQVSSNNLGSKAVADFDGDGLWEVAFSSGGGDVYVFESNGNNTVQLIYHGNMNCYNAYACSYADDMDGNGRPEFVCGGSSSGLGWVTQIYEADGNNSFVIRQEIVINDGYFGVPGNACGDLDGDGIDELIIQIAQALHIYKWNGIEWVNEGIIPENFGSIQHGVFSYDGNTNGYEDIFWLGLGDSGYWTNETINLEYEYAGGSPDVTINLTPQGIPIIIPSTGGSFDYNLEVANNEANSVDFDVWIMVQLPDSAWFGPVLGPVSITLPGGVTGDRDRTQNVPEGAPAGSYLYMGRVGVYPNDIWDSDSFEFSKAASSVFGGNGVQDWSSYGEPLTLGAGSFKPEESVLIRLYPNPFNPMTAISYKLQASSYVNLTVYDIAGRQVAELVNGWRDVGAHKVIFDGSDLPSGVYIYRLTAGQQTPSGKMILLK